MTSLAPAIFRPANRRDIAAIGCLDIRFHYGGTFREEIAGAHASHFRWLLYEKAGRICGFHRAYIVSGWAFWAGVYSDGTDGLALHTLSREVAADLKSLPGLRGQLAWTNDAASPKAEYLRRLGFRQYPYPIYRLRFSDDSLAMLRGVGETSEGAQWRQAQSSDSAAIAMLAQKSEIFVPSLEPPGCQDFSKWYVRNGPGGIDAALNWWRHGDILDVHFVLGESIRTDVTQGLAALAAGTAAEKTAILRVNLQENFSTSLIRLMAMGPTRYARQVGVSLFRRMHA